MASGPHRAWWSIVAGHSRIQHMRDGTLRVAERPEKHRDLARLP
jgi:hypothetical protein